VLCCGIPQKERNESAACRYVITLYLLFVLYNGRMMDYLSLKHVAKFVKETISCVLTDDSSCYRLFLKQFLWKEIL